MRNSRNNYSWCLDTISHGTAHYSKNWDKADQDEYNAKYYQEHKEKWGVKGDRSSGSKYSEYNANDPDFAESNYSDSNLIAGTDFYTFTGANGNTVVLEEDMKWELPAGQKADKDLGRRLRAFDDEVTTRRQNGEKVSGQQWRDMATAAINGTSDVNAANKVRQKSALGSNGSSANVNKYLDDIYSQAESHLKEKGIDPESAVGKEFYRKFNDLVAQQAKTIK